MNYKLGERSLKNLDGVHPNLVKVMKAAIVNSPVDFTITEGVRTLKRQQELYAQGRTKQGIKVTNADGIKNKSNHQAKADGFGHAVDLYPFFLGQVQVNHKDTIKNLKLIADHVKKVAKELGIGITWGGDWKFVDCPHFELK
ncbi:M15 family metallopeptidase [Elizabethkingia anophelis]|uniref:M15 family metallopeptidase n=1 Tax=Elizabethkingia anophelis TaxID=1117645 RepID=UPI0034625AE5